MNKMTHTHKIEIALRAQMQELMGCVAFSLIDNEERSAVRVALRHVTDAVAELRGYREDLHRERPRNDQS